MELPKHIEQFILRNIDSVAELEGLLLLRREQERGWTVDEVAARLYVSRPQADVLLQNLKRRGFLAESSGSYSYHPLTAELASTVDEVSEVYAKALIPVTNLIHSKPNSAVQSFADSFRFREKK